MSRTFRLGLFIVVTLALFAASSFLIGDKQLLFSSTYQVRTTFTSVGGLAEGAEVRVGGVHKGIVKRIELPDDPAHGVVVSLKMARSTRDVLRADSVASIQTEGLLGNKYVDVSFGSPNGAPIADNGVIASEPPLEMADLWKTTQQMLENVRDGSASLSSISAKIDEGQGTMGALVNDRAMYTQMAQATAQAKAGAAAFQENMQALKHNFFLRGFFNNRGYQDATKLTEHEIPRLPSGPVLKTFHFEVAKIFADETHAKLKNPKALGDAGRFLEANPFRTAVVVASNDMRGDAADIRTLTQARAMVIRDYLVNNFRMDDTRVKTMGLGKREGAAEAEGGAVDVVVYAEGR